MMTSARLVRWHPVWAAALVVAALTSCNSPDRGVNRPTASESKQTTPEARVHRHLSEDEASGGHTLRKHVGRNDDELRERLRREPNIAAASSYSDQATAEIAISEALEQNREKISRWSRRSSHPNLVLDYDSPAGRPLGRTLRRGENEPQPCAHAVVILRWSGNDRYYVLTSYPECR
jgi:Bacterial CdiA-CT RNAse A domain